ncbi:MAG: sulfotransferase family protein [Anaerolineae bacterium]|nr:sulfotransferase family protein [Anaerolineae bacterium]
MPNSNCLRLSVWSGPRNISTALMYSFAQRADTRVVDEPLYGHYLSLSHADHPGREEVIAAMENDSERVVREVILGPCDRPVLFLKNMSHHLMELDWAFLNQLTNVLLIRNPEEMLPSLAENLAQPILRDTGYKFQVELLDYLLERGQTPPVLEARELLSNPASVLRQLCERIGLPFDQAMLHWPAGARPEDGLWAKYWYHNLHRSTGFMPYRPKTDPFPPHLHPLLDECRPYYERLLSYTIKAEPVTD